VQTALCMNLMELLERRHFLQQHLMAKLLQAWSWKMLPHQIYFSIWLCSISLGEVATFRMPIWFCRCYQRGCHCTVTLCENKQLQSCDRIISDETSSWTSLMITLNREQLLVCCDTFLPFISYVQIKEPSVMFLEAKKSYTEPKSCKIPKIRK
jgi:hypothetical protein